VAKGLNYEQMIRDVAKMQIATQHIPAIVSEEIQKGWKQLPNTDASRSPKTWFVDPLALQYSLGYKDRRFSLTYDTLKRISGQLSIVNAIINTRAAQVSAFAEPYRKTRSLGFVIKHKDPDHATTPAEIAFIKELESFILNCGRAEKNPYSRVPRDDFESFLRKLVRDSLTYDQACIEIVPDNIGYPFEFLAVDSSTIRIASDDRYVGINSSYHSRSGFVPGSPSRFAGLYNEQGNQYDGPKTADGERVDYVQVINGQIENIYSHSDLAFGVRNPRTDIYIQGYGYGELEQLITVVTAHLNAEEYNRNFFTQGSTPKGMLNMKGDNWAPEELEAFKRQWTAMVQGVENSWRMPVINSEGVDWIDMAKTNQEMEFGKWIEYLIKITCGVFLIDPAELNFDMQGGVQQTPLFESSQEWKLKASRDRGLKPLLKFIAKLINRHIIDKIDDHFTLEFVGLDEMSEQEKHEMLVEQISSYLTLNEARKQLDLPPLEGGDIPMNPVFMQAQQLQQQAQQMEQGGEEEGMPPEGEEPPPEGEEEMAPQLPGSDPAMEDAGPQYAGAFGLPDMEGDGQ
jgi:hypothetical protein